VSLREDRAWRPPAGAASEAATLREQAVALQDELDHLELSDWPGWLRYGAMLAERITELKRQASMMEEDARRIED
jgi:hypothetical protein